MLRWLAVLAVLLLISTQSDPAQLVIRPNQTTTLDAGNAVSFTCVAYGVPNPSISWNGGNTLLTNGSRTTSYEQLLIENGVTFVRSILQLCNAEVAEAGQYSCVANNTIGSDTASFELAVTEIAQAQFVIRPNQTTSLDAGNAVSFICVAYGVPNPSISWNRGNTLLTNGSRTTSYEQLLIENGVTFVQSILQLCNAEVAEAGQYSCFANNTLGNDTAFFELAVAQDPAQLVIRPNQTTSLDAGNAVSFTCVAYGVPNPSISWNRGNTLLTNGSRTTSYEQLLIENGVTFVRSILQLCNAEVAEAGQYSCFANNTLGNDTAFFELAVAQVTPSEGSNVGLIAGVLAVGSVTIISITIVIILIIVTRRRQALVHKEDNNSAAVTSRRASGMGNVPMAECVAYGELATHLTRREGGYPVSHSFPGGVIEGQQGMEGEKIYEAMN